MRPCVRMKYRFIELLVLCVMVVMLMTDSQSDRSSCTRDGGHLYAVRKRLHGRACAPIATEAVRVRSCVCVLVLLTTVQTDVM